MITKNETQEDDSAQSELNYRLFLLHVLEFFINLWGLGTE
jgi:hypothetical protein